MSEWVILNCGLGLNGRKYQSDRRLASYYNKRYNDSGIQTKVIFGMIVLPNNTEKDKKRIHRIYKHFFPHIYMYRMTQVVPFEVGIDFNYEPYLKKEVTEE